MRKSYIIVEDETDQILLEKLITDLQHNLDIQVRVAGSRNSVRSTARTIQVVSQKPVVLIKDSDTLNSEAMGEEQLLLESYLHYSSTGIPFLVTLIMPSLEVIFFKRPEILRDVFDDISQQDLAIGEYAPDKILQKYLNHHNLTFDAFIARLSQDHLDRLRQVDEIAQVRAFLQNIAERELAP